MTEGNPLVIGRVVHYVESVREMAATPVCRAALVVAVHPDGPNLAVFPAETASPYLSRRTAHGQRVRTWHWPNECGASLASEHGPEPSSCRVTTDRGAFGLKVCMREYGHTGDHTSASGYRWVS